MPHRMKWPHQSLAKSRILKKHPKKEEKLGIQLPGRAEDYPLDGRLCWQLGVFLYLRDENTIQKILTERLTRLCMGGHCSRPKLSERITSARKIFWGSISCKAQYLFASVDVHFFGVCYVLKQEGKGFDEIWQVSVQLISDLAWFEGCLHRDILHFLSKGVCCNKILIGMCS